MLLLNSKRMAKLAGLLKEQAVDEWVDEGEQETSLEANLGAEQGGRCRRCEIPVDEAGFCERCEREMDLELENECGACWHEDCPPVNNSDEGDCDKCPACNLAQEADLDRHRSFGMDEDREILRKNAGIWGRPASAGLDQEYEDKEYCLDCGEEMVDSECPRERQHSENYGMNEELGGRSGRWVPQDGPEDIDDNADEPGIMKYVEDEEDEKDISVYDALNSDDEGGMNESFGSWVSRQGPLDDREGTDNDPGGFFDMSSEEEGTDSEKDISVYDALKAGFGDGKEEEPQEGYCDRCNKGYSRCRCSDEQIGDNERFETDNREGMYEISSDAPSSKRFGGLDSHPDAGDTDIECSACGEVYDGNDTEYHKSHLRGHKAAAENKSFTGRMDEDKHFQSNKSAETEEEDSGLVKSWQRCERCNKSQDHGCRCSATELRRFGEEDVLTTMLEQEDDDGPLKKTPLAKMWDAHRRPATPEEIDAEEDEREHHKNSMAASEEPIDLPEWERDAWGKIIDPAFPDDADKEFRQRGWDEQEALYKKDYHGTCQLCGNPFCDPVDGKAGCENVEDADENSGNPFRGNKGESQIKFESLKIMIRRIIKEVAKEQTSEFATKGKTK